MTNFHLPLFMTSPLDDLTILVEQAVQAGARRLLILSGKPVVCRIGDELSPPMTDERLHFQQVQALVKELLNAEQKVMLDKDGACEFLIELGKHSYTVNVFFGDGSHNVIVFLDEAGPGAG